MPDHKVRFGVGLGAWNGADVASTAESVRLVAQADQDGLDLFTVVRRTRDVTRDVEEVTAHAAVPPTVISRMRTVG